MEIRSRHEGIGAFGLHNIDLVTVQAGSHLDLGLGEELAVQPL